MVKPASNRWNEIRVSEFPWEREALDFIREGLPDEDPYRAWSNFEFIAQDGGINEVDLLVLTPSGLKLIEIKSRPGTISGDAGTWEWRHERRSLALENPLLLANRKAKKLKGLLESMHTFGSGGVPYVEALVFLSAPDMDCRLTDRARTGVHLRDRADRPGILRALTAPSARPVDQRTAKAVFQAIQKAGIRAAPEKSLIGDYELGDLLFEGKGYQDFLARHPSLANLQRRVRVYGVAKGATKEQRASVARAARREFEILLGIDHPGILKAVDYRDDARGSALFFEHDPEARRLDHLLASEGASLTLDQRLTVLRKVAEAVGYAHGRRLFHRALSPASLLVRPRERGQFEIKIFNWQTASREIGLTTSGSARIDATDHLDQWVDDATSVYLAPETLLASEEDAAPQDIFGLGALAYFLFTGTAPADSFVDLQTRLREGQGLQLTGAIEGASEYLRQLVQNATHPEVSMRFETVEEFLADLDACEDRLTAPDPKPAVDPTEAKAGDLLEGRFQVLRCLGRGSSAVVFLVSGQDGEQVLKLALTPELNSRLAAEAALLKKAHHHLIVALRGEVTLGAHKGLLLDRAGETTLGQRLRSEGRLGLDLLARFGEDLLQILEYLEEEGLTHRDIKPDNIGIAQRGKKDELRLVLFDFSLAATSPEALYAGTRPYLDPFFQSSTPTRRRFDHAAERWSAAMTLHEMATGTLPRFGDGKSDPAVITNEVTLDADLFEASLRGGLRDFFRRALRRNAKDRFDNAREMVHAWRSIFADLDRPEITTHHEADDSAATAQLIAKATPDSALAELGLSTRALNALERVQALHVKDLLALPDSRLHYLRGVGSKTRRELLNLRHQLAARLPASPVPAPASPNSPPSGVDALLAELLPPSSGKSASQSQYLARWLGLVGDSEFWPRASQIADAAGCTVARVYQVVKAARENLGELPSQVALREQIAQVLSSRGGILTAHELAQMLNNLRGSSSDEPLRTRQALALVRFACEVERSSPSPRWDLSRVPHTALLATPEAGGPDLAEYVQRLAAEADRLAAVDPLPSAAFVQECLSRINRPATVLALSPQRQPRLAAAASKTAALSPRLEFYPRGLPAARALKLASGALLGADTLTPQNVRDRILARFPESEPLPGPPALVQLIEAAGWPFDWDPAAAGGSGQFRLRGGAALATSSTGIHRRTTDISAPPGVAPGVADARLFEAKLTHALREGGFLVLMADPRTLAEAERELRRRFESEIEVVDLEARLLRAMHAEADRARVRWEVVLNADAADRNSRDFQNLLRLVDRGIASLEPELAATPRTLLVHRLGLLARYDRHGLVERLRDRPGNHGLWVLIPADEQRELPVLDGRTIPVLSRNQWARVPLPWIENHHRTPA